MEVLHLNIIKETVEEKKWQKFPFEGAIYLHFLTVLFNNGIQQTRISN